MAFIQAFSLSEIKYVFSTFGVVPIVILLLFFCVKLYRFHVEKKVEKLDLHKEKMEFIANFFSHDDLSLKKSFREVAYSYLYDTVVGVDEIEYFDRFPNPPQAFKDYALCRGHFFDFDFVEKKVKVKYVREKLDKLSSSYEWIFILSFTLFISPVIFTLPGVLDYFRGDVPPFFVIPFLLGLIIILVMSRELYRLQSAKRLVKQKEDFEKLCTDKEEERCLGQ